MKVEVDVLSSPPLIVFIGLSGRKATFDEEAEEEEEEESELRCCVKVEVAVLGSRP